ncbi:MAG: hydroxyacylglutathione hydrolase C-terminal domain-containing protein, partial [Neisseria sp.]|nr:hydroxyacylglutathione hydrolase C-terminal domain-containing protein [Neisseria sp.]
NPDIQTALQAAENTPTLPVTLAHEKRINPFLRTAEPAVRQAALEQGATDDSGSAVFTALREWKNRF